MKGAYPAFGTIAVGNPHFVLTTSRNEISTIKLLVDWIFRHRKEQVPGQNSVIWHYDGPRGNRAMGGDASGDSNCSRVWE